MLRFLPVALLLLGVIACNPIYYSPNTQNVPLLSERGAKSISLAGNTNRAEGQVAIAVTDKMALAGNAAIYFPKDLDNGNGGRGGLFEVGPGYFTALNENTVFEVYGLLGFGGFRNYFPGNAMPNEPEPEIHGNMLRVAAQPALGFRWNFAEIALSTRLAYLHYLEPDGQLTFEGRDEVAYLAANNQQYLLEPAITIRGGLRDLKLQLQLGYSLNLGDRDFPQDETFLTIGVQYRPK